MSNKPIARDKVYAYRPPRGYHDIRIWNSEKEPGKYSFSITAPGGFGWISKCSSYPEDSYLHFGQFDTPEEAIEAAKKYMRS